MKFFFKAHFHEVASRAGPVPLHNVRYHGYNKTLKMQSRAGPVASWLIRAVLGLILASPSLVLAAFPAWLASLAGSPGS